MFFVSDCFSIMERNKVVLATFTLTFVLVSEAFKLPSPPEMCESMIPLHLRGISPQRSESPYRLILSHTHIKSGAHFDITLTSDNSSELFRGFMLQVRNDNTSKPFGVFVRTPETKYLYCSPGKRNVLANNNNKDRRVLKTSWACPPRFRGLVHAIITVIRNEKEYWVGLKSSIVEIGQFTGARVQGYDISIEQHHDVEDFQSVAVYSDSS